MTAKADDDALADACRRLAGDAPHGRQPALGARRHARPAAPPSPGRPRGRCARPRAAAICDEDVATCRAIGEHGLPLIRAAAARKPAGEPVNILTHCNAGWLATVDWGTATAPVYMAHDAGLPVHVWVDETRPRNQGASLTAFELGQHGVPHTVIVDNAGGHLMQHGDGRPSASSAPIAPPPPATSPTRSAPISRRSRRETTASRSMSRCRRRPSTGRFADGVTDIPIERRAPKRWRRSPGAPLPARWSACASFPAAARWRTPAFDVTPARLVDGLITDPRPVRSVARRPRPPLPRPRAPTVAERPGSRRNPDRAPCAALDKRPRFGYRPRRGGGA